MSCRESLGGKAASAAATALTRRSADDVPQAMHRLRREFDQRHPDASRPSGEDAAQALERLAWMVSQREDLPAWRRERVARKCARAAVALRAGRGVPSAAMLHAWASLPGELDRVSA